MPRLCHCGHAIGDHTELLGCLGRRPSMFSGEVGCLCHCSPDEAMHDRTGCPDGEPWTVCGLLVETLAAEIRQRKEAA